MPHNTVVQGREYLPGFVACIPLAPATMVLCVNKLQRLTCSSGSRGTAHTHTHIVPYSFLPQSWYGSSVVLFLSPCCRSAAFLVSAAACCGQQAVPAHKPHPSSELWQPHMWGACPHQGAYWRGPSSCTQLQIALQRGAFVGLRHPVCCAGMGS